MYLLISAAGALLPSLVLFRYFYHRDHNPEPHQVLLWTFILGILIVIPVLALQLPLMLVTQQIDNHFLRAAFMAFVCAALVEEFFKFLVVKYYSARNPAFNEAMDGIVYGVTASLGFATLENILFVIGGGLPIAIFRAFTAVPMHAFFGAIAGYYIGQARFHPEKGATAIGGLLAAVVLHGLYDFGLMATMFLAADGGLDGDDIPLDKVGLVLGLVAISLGTLAVSGIWTWLVVRHVRRTQIASEAGIAYTTDVIQR